MITSYEFLLIPWFFKNNCNLQIDILRYLLACLLSLCNLFYRYVHGLKETNSTILVMGINILKSKLTFVQTSRFIEVISVNDSKSVWKTFLFLQSCTTREYDWIKMLVLTDVFSRVPSTKWTVYMYLLFTAHLQTGRWLKWRHFHTPMRDHTLSSDPLMIKHTKTYMNKTLCIEDHNFMSK